MNIHKNMKSLKRNAILLMLFLAFGIFICFGKDESISCSNRNIKCNGGIYHNGNMLGEP